jgi:hypothetical protein
MPKRTNWLIESRIAAGYDTQVQFVEALAECGISKTQNTISMWEKAGKLPPSIVGDPQKVSVIADILNVSIAEIFRQTGFVSDINLSSDIHPEILAMAHRLNLADDETRAWLLEMFNHAIRHTVPEAT